MLKRVILEMMFLLKPSDRASSTGFGRRGMAEPATRTHPWL